MKIENAVVLVTGANRGIGLTIAHQIVQEHRGNIHVQSTEGVGTTFHINLPSHA